MNIKGNDFHLTVNYYASIKVSLEEDLIPSLCASFSVFLIFPLVS